MELEATKNDVIERENPILVAEQKHQEATLQINHLESSVRSLEQETAELIASRSFFYQQISVGETGVMWEIFFFTLPFIKKKNWKKFKYRGDSLAFIYIW
jgi:hypothetical protein